MATFCILSENSFFYVLQGDGLVLLSPLTWILFQGRGNNIGGTAGSACNMLNICLSHGGRSAGQRFSPLLPPPRVGRQLVYPSVSIKFRAFELRIIIGAKNDGDLCFPGGS